MTSFISYLTILFLLTVSTTLYRPSSEETCLNCPNECTNDCPSNEATAGTKTLNEDRLEAIKRAPLTNQALAYGTSVYAIPAGTDEQYIVREGGSLQEVIDNACGGGSGPCHRTIYLEEGIYEVGDIRLREHLTLRGEKTNGGNGVILTGREPLDNLWELVDNTGEKKWRYEGYVPDINEKFNNRNITYNSNEDSAQNCDTNCNFCPCENGNFCKFVNDLFIADQGQAVRWGTQVSNSVANSSLLNQDGDYIFDRDQQKIILYSDKNPNGPERTVYASERRRAFINAPASVTISNITFQEYSDVAFVTGKEWQVLRSTFRRMHRDGIVVTSCSGTALSQEAGREGSVDPNRCVASDKVIVKRCRFVNNGRTGLSVGATNGSAVVECEIAKNNQAGFTKGNHAGGLKATRAAHLTVKHNYVHDNNGTGLWTDVYTYGTKFHSNVVENNFRGIHYEICQGNASFDSDDDDNNDNPDTWEVYDNYVVGGNYRASSGVSYTSNCSGAGGDCYPRTSEKGIFVVSSFNVEVRYNTIVDAITGIEVLKDQRGFTEEGDPTDVMENILVRNNRIKQSKPCFALASFRVVRNEGTIDNFFIERNISFNDNQYIQDKPGGNPTFYWGKGSIDGSIVKRWDAVEGVCGWRRPGVDVRSCYYATDAEATQRETTVSGKATANLPGKRDVEESSDTKVYPVPFANVLEIRSPALTDALAEVIMTDMNGRMYSIAFEVEDNQLRADTRTLPIGSYVLTVRQNQGTYHFRVRKGY